MWFRADLRAADNAALFNACDGDVEVVGLFVITPDEWRQHDYAPVRIELMLRCLAELSATLAKLRIPLKIIESPSAKKTAELVVDAAKRFGCSGIYWNDEYEVNESRRDEAVRKLAREQGLATRSFTDQVVLDPRTIKTGEGRFYTVFTPFKKAWTRTLLAEGGVKVLPAPSKRSSMCCEPDVVPARVKGIDSGISAELWPGGESHARSRLERFASNGMSKYKEERDYPWKPATSVISPYLAVGAISPRQCVDVAVKINKSPTPYESGSPDILHWISEVCWREFFVHVLTGFPRVCMNRAFQVQTERIEWSDNTSHLEAWKAGRTGIPIVDAGMRQLLATGWMHNRIRMVTAMFLTKNLFIDWREGERFFMRHLVDGFFASNNGGWQWSASTGTDAAPYFRIFNPISQGQKFDADGEYVRTWVPELREISDGAIHELHDMPRLLRSQIDYPEPIVDLSETREKAIEAFKSLR
jgi:deoxyribodipyrimidine photo-lyase